MHHQVENGFILTLITIIIIPTTAVKRSEQSSKIITITVRQAAVLHQAEPIRRPAAVLQVAVLPAAVRHPAALAEAVEAA